MPKAIRRLAAASICCSREAILTLMPVLVHPVGAQPQFCQGPSQQLSNRALGHLPHGVFDVSCVAKFAQGAAGVPSRLCQFDGLCEPHRPGDGGREHQADHHRFDDDVGLHEHAPGAEIPGEHRGCDRRPFRRVLRCRREPQQESRQRKKPKTDVASKCFPGSHRSASVGEITSCRYFVASPTSWCKHYASAGPGRAPCMGRPRNLRLNDLERSACRARICWRSRPGGRDASVTVKFLMVSAGGAAATAVNSTRSCCRNCQLRGLPPVV